MNTTDSAVRRELKGFIDKIPEQNLEILRPILSYFAKNQEINDSLVIETDLTKEEKVIIQAGRKERMEHPENFTPWAAIKAEIDKETNKI